MATREQGMAMNILIPGGAGYIGGAITDLLPDARVYDSLLYEHEYRKDRNFVLGDVRDREKLKEQLDWADAVIWLAAIVGDGACASNPQLTQEVNADAVKWLSENFDGRIIFPSTCSVYGAQDGILTEESLTNPLSIYASTKLEAEGYLKNKNAMIFRLGTVFGVSDKFSRVRLDLVVNTMTAKAYTSGKLQVFGGEQWRPLVHVKDVAQELVNALASDKKGIKNLCVSNVRMKDLAETVAAMTGATVETVGIKFEDARNYRVVENLKSGRDTFVGISEVLAVLPRIKDPDNPRYSNALYMESNYVN
jgi:nucleoside-diphosphate-sugar epimerase